MKLITGYIILFFFVSCFAYTILKRKSIFGIKLQTQNIHMTLGMLVLIISIIHISMSKINIQMSFGWLTLLLLILSIFFGFLFRFQKPSKIKRLIHIISSVFAFIFLIFHMVEMLIFL